MKMILNKLPTSGDAFFDNLAKEKVWLSSADAAQFLGLTQNALRILACRGKVKFYKIGRRLRFLEADLEKLLKRGT